jgi:hypothetical protein
MKSVIFSEILLNLFFASLLTLVGLGFGLYPIMKGHYQPLFHLLSEKPWIVPASGLCLGASGVMLFRKVYSHLVTCHFETVAGKIKTWVDENALEKILQEFWKEKFSDSDLTCYPHIYDNKLHIAAELPPEQSSDEMLKALRSDLSERLHDSVGYTDEFSLALVEKDAFKPQDEDEQDPSK